MEALSGTEILPASPHAPGANREAYKSQRQEEEGKESRPRVKENNLWVVHPKDNQDTVGTSQPRVGVRTSLL